jgi:hypothetical protein
MAMRTVVSSYFPVAWSSNCAHPISVQASLNRNEFLLPDESEDLKYPQNTFIYPGHKAMYRKNDPYIQRGHALQYNNM